MINVAKELINKYHSNQVDKGGNPYIDHLMYVSENMVSEIGKTAGLLHDIKEDTPITDDILTNKGISQEVIKIINILTRNKDQSYSEYIDSIINSNNIIAMNIKKIDLSHNMDITRIPNPSDKDYKRIATRYKKAYEKINKKLLELNSITTINLYLDDLRKCPKGFIIAKTYEDAIFYLKHNNINILSLDHDLGEKDEVLLKTGYDFVKFLCENKIKNIENIYIHTDNPVGRENMYETLKCGVRHNLLNDKLNIYNYPLTPNKY